MRLILILLTVIFVVAKLLGFVTWSWPVVFIPLYGIAAFMVVTIFIVVGAVVLGVMAERRF